MLLTLTQVKLFKIQHRSIIAILKANTERCRRIVNSFFDSVKLFKIYGKRLLVKNMYDCPKRRANYFHMQVVRRTNVNDVDLTACKKRIIIAVFFRIKSELGIDFLPFFGIHVANRRYFLSVL